MNANTYEARVGVTDVKPVTQGVMLNLTICGSFVLHDEELVYTLQCPGLGVSGRYLVIQTDSEGDKHSLVLCEVTAYGYGKHGKT